MSGPQIERLAQFEQRLTNKPTAHRLENRTHNPLNQIVDRLRRTMTDVDSLYTPQLMDSSIENLDRITAVDGKLGPMLLALEKENVALRQQLSVMEQNFSNTLGCLEQVISENEELKIVVAHKNEDLTKIVSTIAHHQSQTVSELEAKCALLEQENAILLAHMEQAKLRQDGLKADIGVRENQVEVWREKWEEAKRAHSEAANTERKLTRKLTTIEQNLNDATDKNTELEQRLRSALVECQNYKHQLAAAKTAAQNQSAAPSLTHKYEQLQTQARLLRTDQAELLRQCQQAKLNSEKLSQQLISVETQLNKATMELEAIKQMLTDQKRRNATLLSTINQIETKCDSLKQESMQLQLQLDSTHQYAVSKERMLQQEVDSLRKAIDEANGVHEKKLRDIRDKTKALLDQKDTEMVTLNDTNNELRRLVELMKRESRE